jgi:peptide/nickel transport system substrate-binding protein
VFGLSSYAPSLAPWANAGTAAGTVKLMIHRGLLSYDTTGALRGELAEQWMQDGPTAWVFKLRETIFNNGDKLESAYVKWNIEQISAEKSTAYFRAEMQGIDRIETPDARTLRLVTKEPSASLPQWFASYHLPIISRKSQPSDPIGAGPFVLKSQERGACASGAPSFLDTSCRRQIAVHRPQWAIARSRPA